MQHSQKHARNKWYNIRMSEHLEEWLTTLQTKAIPALIPNGTIIDNYRILGLIGKGGFSEVYAAEHIKQATRVAIKILVCPNTTEQMRFQRECEIVENVRHPNIPRFFAKGNFNQHPYIVIERLIESKLPSKSRDVAIFLLKLTDALKAIHAYGFVHRDVKPANIMQRENGEPVLIDFGLACPLKQAQRIVNQFSISDGRPLAVGTPGYAAPEQMDGGDISEATDVHGIGVVAYECFEGAPPSDWKGLINRATSSRAFARHQSMEALAKVIKLRARPFWRRYIDEAIDFTLWLIKYGLVLITIAYAFDFIEKKFFSSKSNNYHESSPNNL